MVVSGASTDTKEISSWKAAPYILVQVGKEAEERKVQSSNILLPTTLMAGKVTVSKAEQYLKVESPE